MDEEWSDSVSVGTMVFDPLAKLFRDFHDVCDSQTNSQSERCFVGSQRKCKTYIEAV